MSKNILLFLIATLNLILNPSQLLSQETAGPSGQEIKLGVRGGINFADLSTQNATNNIMVGLNLGAFAKVPVTKYFAFQPEFNFSMKGAIVDYANSQVTGSAKYAFNYIEIPLLGVFNFTENLSIHAGPYFAYLLNGTAKNNSTNNTFDFETSINLDNYNRIDAGAAIGAALNVDNFGLGVRYARGFSTIGNESTISGVLLKFPDAVNSVYSMYVAVSF